MPLKFIKSEKGRDMLVHKHFVYTLERKINNKILWRCEHQIKKKCPGRAHTEDDEVVKLSRRQHNHLPNVAKIEARRTVDMIKCLAKSSEISSHAVLDTVSAQLSPVVSAQLPPRYSLKRTIQRVRHVSARLPDEPKTMDFDVPADYRTTPDGERFLLYDNRDGRNRILIFSTRENLKLMAGTAHWLADGTFATVPVRFAQMYTVHCVRRSDVVPAAYALLQNRDEETYAAMFAALKSLEPGLGPETITLDFERTAAAAARLCFPGVSIKGCHFHMSRSVWRLAKQIGLSEMYINDAEYAAHIRCLCALAYVPAGSVVRYYESLMATRFFVEHRADASFADFISYFESTWIGAETRRKQRKPPFFPIDEWNCYERSRDGAPGTSSSAEGWHDAFAAAFDATERPSVWKFIRALQKQDGSNRRKVMEHLSGERPGKKKRYNDPAEKIVKICREFHDRSAEEYLKEISYHLLL